jgi:hypothetical protein
VFRALAQRLKPSRAFVFSLPHPGFNNSSCVHLAEEMDDEGEIQTLYSVKVSRHLNSHQAFGRALRGQTREQSCFERPLGTI